MKTFLLILIAFIQFASTPLSPATTPNEPLTLNMIGHAHIDLAYRWRWNETVDQVLFDTFNGVLELMEQTPGVTFAQSQIAFYEQVMVKYPDLFRRIREKIQQGTWSVVGGQWCEMDESMTGGESLIRQFLIGVEFSEKYLGLADFRLVWSPDAFSGHVNTLPQIYAGCGIQYYLFMRKPPTDKRIFWWEGPDGSRLLAYNTPGAYNNKINERLLEGIQEWYQFTRHNNPLVLYGEGDHGGGPRATDIRALEELQQAHPLLSIQYETPEKYFEALAKLNREWPVHRTELGMSVDLENKRTGSWQGCYTSQAKLKQANRVLENRLLTAEKWATIGSQLQGKPFHPRVDLRDAWKLLLKNQFHDILPGTSVGPAVDDAMEDYATLETQLDKLLDFGLEAIGARIDTRGQGIPLVIFNPNSWHRTDYVNARIRFQQPPTEFKIINEKKQDILFDLCGWSSDGHTALVNLLAQEIPPVGYKVLRVMAGEKSAASSPLSVNTNQAANEFYQVQWDETGLTRIYDKKTGRELLKAPGNLLRLYEEAPSSSWSLNLTGKMLPLVHVAGPEIIKQTDLEVVVQWQERSTNSFFTRQMMLRAGIPRIDFRMTIDWHEHDQLLRVVFPTSIEAGHAVYEQPYGYIERPQEPVEYPAQNWVALANEDFGVALLSTAKYGFMINQSEINMSIVRGARDMDPRMDEGEHTFEYALVTHAGKWRAGDATRRALEVNQLLVARQENPHAGVVSGWTSQISLPLQHSFYTIEPDQVIISAIKVQQGEWTPTKIVLRIFETSGWAGQVKVQLPVRPMKIIETNHLEKPLPQQPEIKVADNFFRFQIGHNQIRTFLIEY